MTCRSVTKWTCAFAVFCCWSFLARWTLHCHSLVIDTLWKHLETTLGLLLCEKVAISTLVPGEVAVMDTFFSILSPGCRRVSLGERERERERRDGRESLSRSSEQLLLFNSSPGGPFSWLRVTVNDETVCSEKLSPLTAEKCQLRRHVKEKLVSLCLSGNMRFLSVDRLPQQPYTTRGRPTLTKISVYLFKTAV